MASDLGNPKNTIEILQKYQFTFSKRFGQNFLIDNHVIGKILNAAEVNDKDMVLEIGPGIGTLTQHLASKARLVVAVEIDDKLIPILKDTLSDYDNVLVIHEDILKVDLNEIAEKYNDGKPIRVVANLPYYITTPIIMSLFESHMPLESVTVMVQKEVADRMSAGPGSKDYGALSLAVAYYAEPYLAANVPPNCFIPRPNVGSAVIRLTRHKNPPVPVKDEVLLFTLIRGAFNMRRKTLSNALTHHEPLHDLTREMVTEALSFMGLSETIRGEAMTLAQFAELSDYLTDHFQIRVDRNQGDGSKNAEKVEAES